MSVNAQTVDIIFDYEFPTTKEDGSALLQSEIERFEISKVGGGVIATINPLDANDVPITTRTVENFTLTGDDCFTIATVATYGGRSSESEPACIPSNPNSGSITIRFVGQVQQ